MTFLLGLIRHGVTEWNAAGRTQGQRDIPLSGEGRKQANALGTRIPPDGWDVLYSSDLSRAAETARIIGEHADLEPVLLDVRLRERSFGPLEGLTRREREERWGERPFDTPGVEPAADVTKRGLEFVREVQQKHSGGRVLAVTHGAFIRHLLPALLREGAEPEGDLNNASLTILHYDGRKWRCLLFNGNVPVS
ncbi:histidine phosphatase family protein [Paenibacillus alkalitolerans]|uniref:histidine phosphatase family protein n=1 Tax=Paenibacillus alkalitolerans TaxID=2799335 RepID=UPI001F440E4F|nr:histidine phosphatase family protein [Paenibacillus alkalitolerans]